MRFPQRLLADDERLELVLRRHVKVLFGPVVLLVVAVTAFGASFLIPAGAQPWAWYAVGVIALVVAIRWVLWPFLDWYNTVYAITTRRLILRTGVLNRSGHDMPLSRLNDVSFEHNLFERMLGCGTLVVESAGERGQIRLRDVPRVELVQRTLYRLSDDVRGGRRSTRIDPDLDDTLDEEFDDRYPDPPDYRPDDGPDERRR